MRKLLITIVIDFKEAFDTIKKKSLVECINKFRIHPHIIDVISEIDQNDSTTLYLNNEIVTNVQVSSGIRQGCTGSTSLLLLLTYIIILYLNLTQCGFRDEICYTLSLLYADDGILLAQSEQEATDMMNTLTESGNTCGLEVNKDKSFVMIYNRHKSGQPARHQNHNPNQVPRNNRHK